jgi:hypothetical protein
VPFIPPTGSWTADGYPYYVFPIVGVGVLLLGAVYWAFWTKVFPHFGGYRVESQRSFDETGAEVVRYVRVPLKRE